MCIVLKESVPSQQSTAWGTYYFSPLCPQTCSFCVLLSSNFQPHRPYFGVILHSSWSSVQTFKVAKTFQLFSYNASRMPHLPSLLLLSYCGMTTTQFFKWEELGEAGHCLVAKEIWKTGFEAAFTGQNEIFFRLYVTQSYGKVLYKVCFIIIEEVFIVYTKVLWWRLWWGDPIFYNNY